MHMAPHFLFVPALNSIHPFCTRRAKKIERRAKIVTSELQEIERKARSFSAVVNQEGARLNNGLGLTHNLDRSMKDAQQDDRALAEKPAYLGGGATIKGETETLVKYASASAEFAEQVCAFGAVVVVVAAAAAAAVCSCRYNGFDGEIPSVWLAMRGTGAGCV